MGFELFFFFVLLQRKCNGKQNLWICMNFLNKVFAVKNHIRNARLISGIWQMEGTNYFILWDWAYHMFYLFFPDNVSQ